MLSKKVVKKYISYFQAALNLNDTVNEMKKSANGDGNFVGFLENLLKKKE